MSEPPARVARAESAPRLAVLFDIDRTGAADYAIGSLSEGLPL